MIDVLGTKYTVCEFPRDKDKYLKDRDGYCDQTTKRIVIAQRDEDCELEDYSVYRAKILRHEIIHAFLFESGLHENFKHDMWGHDETMLDWVAVQFPKILEAFKAVGCI